MKNRINKILSGWILTVMLFLLNFSAMAQNDGNVISRTTTTTTRTSTEQWYTMPWVWVAGAAVFVLLLAAILRGGDRRTDA